MATRRERAAYFLLQDRPSPQRVDVTPALLAALDDPKPRVRIAATLAGLALLEDPKPAILEFVRLAAVSELRPIINKRIGWVWNRHPEQAWLTFDSEQEMVKPLLLDLAQGGSENDLRLLFSVIKGMEQVPLDLLEPLRPVLAQPEHKYYKMVEDIFWTSDRNSLRDQMQTRLKAVRWREDEGYRLLYRLKEDPESHQVAARWLVDQLDDEYENHSIVIHFKDLPQGIAHVRADLIALAERQPVLKDEIALALITIPEGKADALRLAGEALEEIEALQARLELEGSEADADFGIIGQLGVFGTYGASLAEKIVILADANSEYRHAACMSLPALAPDSQLVRHALRRWRAEGGIGKEASTALLYCGDTSDETVNMVLKSLQPWGDCSRELMALQQHNLLSKVPDKFLARAVTPGFDDRTHVLAVAAARELSERDSYAADLVERLNASRQYSDRATLRRIDELLAVLGEQKSKKRSREE